MDFDAGVYPRMTIARRRTMLYLVTLAGLAAGSVGLRSLQPWTGTDFLHTLLETMAVLVAFMVGALALARYYGKKDNTFLLIGAAFVGTACLDGYHAVVTSPWLAETFPSPLTALIPWSWLASRLFLSLMLWCSWLAWTRESKLGETGLLNARHVYLGIGAVTLASFLFFALVPTPSAYAESRDVSRPQELVPAAFFLMALIGYLRKGEWRHNAYEHWLILSLLVGTMGQAAIMPTSHRLYDAPFIVNHLLKLLSYLCVLIGLTADAYAVFRRAETNAQEARRATDVLREAHGQLDARVRQRTEELQRLNDALQESEQRFRMLADSAPVMIWMSDTEKRCVYLNRVWLEFTGRALEQDLGHGWVEHVHPNDRAQCVETFGASFDARRGFAMDYRLRRHDGEYRWVLDKGVPRFNGDGRFAGFIGTCTDITERKQAEEIWLNIAKGVSAATGKTFFRSLVEYLAKALDADYVFVGEVTEGRVERVSTIAVCAHGAIVDNFEYTLGNTPCEQVVGQRLCSYPSGVQRQFPKDTWLAEMGIDAYVGTPLFDSTGRPLGLMVALYGQALHNVHFAESVLQVFAARAAAELERKRAEDALQAHELRLEQQLSALVGLMGSDALRANDGQAALRHVTETDARTLGVERVSVWRYNHDRTAIHCIELYELSAHRHSSGAHLNAEAYPSYFRALSETTVIAADDAHRDPRTREFSDTYLRPLGITSMLDAPIHVNGVLDGVLCHEHVGPVRQWTPDEKTLAITVANIVSLVTEQGERKRAEEALRDSEARFRQVTEHIKEVFWLSDPEKNRILYVSSAYEEIWGRTCESLYDSPRSWLDAIHADDRSRVLHAALTQQIAGRYDEEYRIVRPDGSVRWIRDRAFPIRDASNRVYRIAGLAEDITERKEAEEALVKQAHILESMAEGVSLSDEEGFICYTNPAEDAMFGYRQGELVGQHVTVLNTYPPEENARIVGHVIAQLKAHGVWSGEFSNHRKDGTLFTTFARITALTIANKTYWVCVQEDITRRKKAEEALHRSEAHYKTLVESAPVCIHEIDLQGRLASMNQAGLRMMGAAHEADVRGLTYLDLVAPEDCERIGRLLARATAGEPSEFEFSSGTEQSRRRFASGFIPLKDADGTVVKLMGITRDITDQRRAEEALRQSEALFRTAFEDTAVGMALTSVDGRLRRANRFFCGMLGYTEEELLAKTFTDITHPEDREKNLQDVRRLLAGEVQTFHIEKRYLHKLGRPVWAQVSVSLTRDTHGNPVHFIVQAQDIDARKQAEDALRESEQRLRLLAEVIPQQVWTARPDGQLDYVNRRTLDYFERQPEELVGWRWQEVIHPDDLPECLRRWTHALETGRPYEMEFRLKRAGDATYQWHLGRALPLTDEHGRVLKWFGTNTDITERKQLEEQLRQAQKMEAVGRLAGGIAHDFNNLLTVINGHSHRLLSGAGSQDRWRPKVEDILRAGERAAGLTNQLLAFSRKQIIHPQVLSLNRVVADLERILSRLIGEHIELVLALNPDLGSVKADSGQIEQVIMNLALNARDSMPNGGRLTIATMNTVFGQTDADKPPGLPPGAYAKLIVTDTGQGMDKATLAHLFEPFFTTKDVGKGTGLGLATVYGIVAQSGGAICASSTPGQGATFTVCFPQVAQVPEPSLPPGASHRSTRGSETILLAEDERNVRELAREVLEEEGYRVLEARNGVEALAIAGQHTGPIHLLLTDVVMPEMGGHALAQRLTSDRQGLKVLYMSGYTADPDMQQGILGTRAAFLSKPMLPEMLLQKVREVLDAAD